jgi:hypothetical protein
MKYVIEMASDDMIYIYFHDDRFRNSSDIKVFTATILEATVLVLLLGEIYEVYH